MARYPIKILLDENRVPFIPYLPSNAVVVEGTNKTVADQIIDLHNEINERITNVYRFKGSVTFENLPVTGQTTGDVYDITNDFTLDGKQYPAGTNVAWTTDHWDALTGMFSMTSSYEILKLNTAIMSSVRSMYSTAFTVEANKNAWLKMINEAIKANKDMVHFITDADEGYTFKLHIVPAETGTVDSTLLIYPPVDAIVTLQYGESYWISKKIRVTYTDGIATNVAIQTSSGHSYHEMQYAKLKNTTAFTPTAATHLVTKGYVDDNFLSKTNSQDYSVLNDFTPINNDFLKTALINGGNVFTLDIGYPLSIIDNGNLVYNAAQDSDIMQVLTPYISKNYLGYATQYVQDRRNYFYFINASDEGIIYKVEMDLDHTDLTNHNKIVIKPIYSMDLLQRLNTGRMYWTEAEFETNAYYSVYSGFALFVYNQNMNGAPINTLVTNNTEPYTPQFPYAPATKDYVDKTVAENAVYELPIDQNSYPNIVFEKLNKGVYYCPQGTGNITNYKLREADTSSSLQYFYPQFLVILKNLDEVEIPTSGFSESFAVLFGVYKGSSTALHPVTRGTYVQMYFKLNTAGTIYQNSVIWGKLDTDGDQFYTSGKKYYAALPAVRANGGVLPMPTIDEELVPKKYVDGVDLTTSVEPENPSYTQLARTKLKKVGEQFFLQGALLINANPTYSTSTIKLPSSVMFKTIPSTSISIPLSGATLINFSSTPIVTLPLYAVLAFDRNDPNYCYISFSPMDTSAHTLAVGDAFAFNFNWTYLD